MTNSNCPTDEELAAYIDGMLPPGERKRVTEHLASCEGCYELYTEVLRFRLDEQPAVGSKSGEVVPFRGRDRKTPVSSRWQGSPWWIAAAALVLLGSGFGLYRLLAPRPAPLLTVAELLGPIEENSRATQNLWAYARHRGPGDDHLGLDSARQAFQVGALLVDFRLAARERQLQKCSDIWQRIGIVVRDAPFLQEEGERILEEAQQIKAGSLDRVAVRADEVERMLDEFFDPQALAFGKWTEAGRLAAALEEPRFFEQRTNQQFLEFIVTQKEIPLEERAVPPLKEIQALWPQGDLTQADSKALALHFQEILDVYDFRPGE